MKKDIEADDFKIQMVNQSASFNINKTIIY